MTVLGDKLQAAMSKKASDITTYVWKGPKVNGEQQEILMIDASFDQLKQWYRHCQQMLYNEDSKNPGRVTLLEIVQDQISRCRAELLVRWLMSEKQYSNTRCLEDLRKLISNNKDTLTPEAIKSFPISKVMDGLPIDYQQVPVKLVMDACLDLLGIFDNSHITLNFILKMGLWLTPREMQKDLYRKDPETGKARNRLDVVKEELRISLRPNQYLRICDTGLSYTEFKAIYMLQRDKYSNLTSEQLKLLSNKILYRFQIQCEEQAKQWLTKIDEINKVAADKGWDVTRADL
jgi:hypothetical protein